jgi:hypothetical protein
MKAQEALQSGVDILDMVWLYSEEMQRLQEEIRASPGRVCPVRDLDASKYWVKVSRLAISRLRSGQVRHDRESPCSCVQDNIFVQKRVEDAALKGRMPAHLAGIEFFTYDRAEFICPVAAVYRWLKGEFAQVWRFHEQLDRLLTPAASISLYGKYVQKCHREGTDTGAVDDAADVAEDRPPVGSEEHSDRICGLRMLLHRKSSAAPDAMAGAVLLPRCALSMQCCTFYVGLIDVRD